MEYKWTAKEYTPWNQQASNFQGAKGQTTLQIKIRWVHKEEGELGKGWFQAVRSYEWILKKEPWSSPCELSVVEERDPNQPDRIQDFNWPWVFIVIRKLIINICRWISPYAQISFVPN